LTQSFWSYNAIGLHDEYFTDSPMKENPIRMMPYYPGLSEYVNEFLEKVPYTCDLLTDEQHNQHDLLTEQHFSQSYCNIVLETMFDAEQSDGTFLTEKTFKPIRHCQPFIIFGCANSLSLLQKLGYRTFDHAMDNHYDTMLDNGARFKQLMKTVSTLHQQDLHSWYQTCINDIVHNQQLFLAPKTDRLSTLHDKLLYQLATS
jgi:hypothetical protein